MLQKQTRSHLNSNKMEMTKKGKCEHYYLTKTFFRGDILCEMRFYVPNKEESDEDKPEEDKKMKNEAENEEGEAEDEE